MNKDWHRLHPMPRKATREQRVVWHAAHARACACRDVPESIKIDVEDRLKADGKDRPAAG